MKLKTAIPSIAAALLAAVPFASAQNATTDPVGFVTFTVVGNSDQKLGTPMVPSTKFSGTAASVSGTTVTASGIPDLTGSNYLLVTSGPAAGSWESISSSSNSTVNLASSISGFSANHTFVIKPFWTLNTLFPNGGAIPPSPNPEAPVGLILTYDPSVQGINLGASSVYLYHPGGVLPAGWYTDGSFEAAGDIPLSPETSITIRNQSSSSIQVPFAGNVPTQTSGFDIVSRVGGQQDNMIYNQFPSAVTLANSGLAQSGAVANSPNPEAPTDLLLVFDLANAAGYNPGASTVYLYHAGGVLPAGWYSDGSFEAADDVEIPAGGAIIIRKAAGSSSTTKFSPSLPYSLN
jgi:uncharacterized protein (TIGR02597 family)